MSFVSIILCVHWNDTSLRQRGARRYDCDNIRLAAESLLNVAHVPRNYYQELKSVQGDKYFGLFSTS